MGQNFAGMLMNDFVESFQHMKVAPFLIIFAISFLIDFVATYEFHQIQKGKAFVAAGSSLVGVFLASVLVYVFIVSPIYVIPEMLGAFCGTFLMIRLSKKFKTFKYGKKNN